MRNPLLIPNDSNPADFLKGIHAYLRQIDARLEEEVAARQRMLEQKEQELQDLKRVIAEKDAAIEALQKKEVDIRRLGEGNRQIIKKLINDMARQQQDIEWYKRTYETRSLLGTLKEKIIGRRG